MNYLRIRMPDGRFVSSPMHKRTSNPALAATWKADERKDAEAVARTLGGRVEEYAPMNVVRGPEN